MRLMILWLFAFGCGDKEGDTAEEDTAKIEETESPEDTSVEPEDTSEE